MNNYTVGRGDYILVDKWCVLVYVSSIPAAAVFCPSTVGKEGKARGPKFSCLFPFQATSRIRPKKIMRDPFEVSCLRFLCVPGNPCDVVVSGVLLSMNDKASSRSPAFVTDR